MLVTNTPERPHGTIRSKWSRLVVTFSASPCMDTHREMRTPIAQIFPPSLRRSVALSLPVTHTPVPVGSRLAGIPKDPNVSIAICSKKRM